MRGFRMIEATAVAAMIFFLMTRAGQAAPAGPGPGLLEEMRRIEFESVSYDEEATPYYGYIKGSIPILISAPHGAKHYRAAEGAWKAEDAYTSSLAIVLGRLTGAHVLYVKNKTREDPNNDAVTAYKDSMKEIVRENRIRFRARSARVGRPQAEGRYRDNGGLPFGLLLPYVQGCPPRGLRRPGATRLQPVLFSARSGHDHLLREEEPWYRGGPGRDQRQL